MLRGKSIDYGVRCTMGDGEDTLITTSAATPEDALRAVKGHVSLFGGDDAAGQWLSAQRDPSRTIVTIHEAKPLEEWERP